jgi:type I restriction enzyme S subunit
LRDFLLSFNGQKQIEQFQAGGNRQGLNFEQIKSFKLPLPPLPEQRKIAEILSTWDKAISTTERLIDNSKQQKKALMQQLLTGKKRLLDESGTPFQGEWEEITLEKLAKYRRGSFPQPYGNPEWVDEVNGYPFIQVYDIDKNMKLKPDTKIKISDAAIDRSVFIPKETVIVSLQGSIGRVAITQYDAYVDRTVLLFQEFIVPMDKVFFAFIIQELFEIEKTKAPGGTIKTITKEVLSNFKVYIPSYNEQQKIASVLINADQEIELLEQQLADLKQEKKALMQQLLTGKRRVKVDDEAAA